MVDLPTHRLRLNATACMYCLRAKGACCLLFAGRRMGLDNLWKPDLRGRIEQGISRIAAGLVSKQEVSKRRAEVWSDLL